MSKLYEYSGSEDFCPGSSMYTNPKDSSLFLSLPHHVDLYFPPRKRSRITAPFVFGSKANVSIDILPDECLFEIFRRLPGGKERSVCASVSKKWLMLLSTISCHELKSENEAASKEAEDIEIESDGYLSRRLEGKNATDLRLAAAAVGTASRGGLGKLVIRGNNQISKVTDLGLKAISRGCQSLRALSLWNLSSIGDEGLCEIAKVSHQLEKLDLCKCPAVSDKAVIEIARNCPKLTDITIESCARIGNESMRAIGQYCPKLKSIAIKDCSLVGDQGIASLLSLNTCALNKVKLQALNISDVSLAVIGHYGKAVTDLALTDLKNLSEKGFWVMGNGHGLQKLKSFTISSCNGVTDMGLESVGKGTPNLKHFCLRKCSFLSDNGVVAFTKAARSLECMQLEECHRITQFGFFGVLLNCSTNLKALSLISCLGIKDVSSELPIQASSGSLRSLTVRNCHGFGNRNLALLGKLCPRLQNVDFSGLVGIDCCGFLAWLQNCQSGLVKINVSGCVNLTDKVVSSIIKHHGWTLEMLNLNGCRKITDAILTSIANNCPLLSDLDVSKCSITDSGIATLARSTQLNLQIFSVSSCSFVSDKSLADLIKLGETLMGLNIQHCNAISSSTVDLLVGQLWRCDVLS
ncbi:EIN3-binding F-box protein 1-like isoform X2 [Cucurbita moschata]|uniref:EIN3-binding F-box protein 1-like isoform X2 n=1 Tax=Cucurbita moschata TaxID=3662 RepID=A0A6J1FLA8_CUCMO|nr:EIN3-binding F-box protein 1-like isoform X2 [Cucurbita moschata]